MSRSRRAAALAVAFSMLTVTLLLGSASAQEASPTQPEQKRVLTIGTDEDIRTTNPLRSLNGIEAWTFYHMYSGMLWFNRDDLSAAPGLVSDWTQSEDGLTWTFTFREGLKWSDGEPLTAHDFAFTANFLIDNDKEIVSWNKNTDFPFTESITAPDDTTLIWKTSQPTFAPGKPEYYLVLPEHIWGDLSGEEASKFKNFPDPVVSGPFTLTERVQGQFWRLEPNPYWFGEKPNVDEIVFRLFNTDEAIVQALKRGTVDFAEYLPAPLFDSLAGTSDAGSAAGGPTTHIGSAQNFANLNFNLLEADKSTGHPALLDVNVRRAIEFAIDKELLIEKIRRGYSIPGTTVVPPSYPFWHYEPTAEELITFDPAEANRILDEAGYEDTDNDGIREMPGGGRSTRAAAERDLERHGRDQVGRLHRELAEGHRHRRHDLVDEQQQHPRAVLRRRLRHVLVRMGHEPRPGLPPVHVHDGGVRILERHLLGQPRVQRAVREAESRLRPGGPTSARPPAPTDDLQRGP